MRVALRASGGRLDDSIVPLLKPCVGARQPRVVCTREHVGQFMLVSVRPRASELLGSDMRPMCGLSTSAVEAAQSTPVARLSLQRTLGDGEQPTASPAARVSPTESAPAPRSWAPATPTPAAENAALVQVRATLEALQEVQRDFAAEAQALTAARAAREEGEAKLQSRVEAAGAAEAQAAQERRALQEAWARLEDAREGLRTEQLQWAQAQAQQEQQAQAAAEVARRPASRMLAHAAAQTDPVMPPPPIVRYVPRPAPALQSRPRRSSLAATQFALGACAALLLFAFFSSSARASRHGATSSTHAPHVLVPAPMATSAMMVLQPLRSGATYVASLAQAQGRVTTASVWAWLHPLLQSGARQGRAGAGLFNGQPPAQRAIAHKAKPAAPAMRQLAAPRDVPPARPSRAGPAPIPSPPAPAAASSLMMWRLRHRLAALLLLLLLTAVAPATRKSTPSSRRRLLKRVLTCCGWRQPDAAAGAVQHTHHAAPAGPPPSTRRFGGGREDGLGIERTPNSPWHSRRAHSSPHHYDFDD